MAPAGALAPQLAQAATLLAEGRVEIRLAPEELGRVVMTLSVGEGGVSVAVLAERAETLDLLRRNIGLLEQELRDLGYANPGFSFGEGRRPPAGAAAGPHAGRETAEEGPAEGARSASSRDVPPGAGLDLRL